MISDSLNSSETGVNMTTTGRSYTALKIVSVIFSLFGILTLLGTLIAFCAVPSVTETVVSSLFKEMDFAASAVEKEGNLNGAEQIRQIEREWGTKKAEFASGARFVFLLYGLLVALGLFASGELLRLGISIEKQSRFIAETFEKRRL